MREMIVREVHDYLKSAQPQPLLLDVREPWEYNICRLPNTQLIPMRTIPTAFKDLDVSQEIIVICRHGVRSRSVALFLEQQGFSRVINMTGGMVAWTQDIDPTIPTY